MTLLIRAEELKGRISIAEAIAAVHEGYRDQGDAPAYSAPRLRIQHQDRRLSVHPGGCHRLQVAGCFVHAERYTFHGGAQQYETAGRRVYVAYDSETAALTMQPRVRARLNAVESPERAARGADLICLATGSNVPVLFGAWLAPGQHVTSIVAGGRIASQSGSGAPSRRELDDAVIARADCVVATLKAQAILDDQADFCVPVANGLTSWEKIADLGDLVAGRRTGRRSSSDITVFKQNGDQGVGFMALAKLAHEKAQAAGLGFEI